MFSGGWASKRKIFGNLNLLRPVSHLKGHVDKRMNYSETDYQILFKSLLQKKPKNALYGKLWNRVWHVIFRKKRNFLDFSGILWNCIFFFLKMTFLYFRYYQIGKICRIYCIYFTEKDFIQRWTNKTCYELRIMIGFKILKHVICLCHV